MMILNAIAEMEFFAYLSLVLFGAWLMMEFLLRWKAKDNLKPVKIHFADDGKARKNSALKTLEQARLTAKANKS